MSQTQDARIEAKTTQVSTTRAINQEMTAATQDMIQRVKPVFERQKAIADQALEIQSMSPIARAVRGFFDLNYNQDFRSEEHTSELQSLMRISYAVFCLKKNTSEQAITTAIKDKH